MKVLVVGTSGGVVSGISTAADQTVRTLERNGHEVTRVSAGSRRRQKPSRINWENMAAVLGDAVRVFRLVRVKDAELVWYHTFGVPTLPAVRALTIAVSARAAGARAVVRLHPYGFDDWLDEGGRTLRTVVRLLDRVASALVVEFESAATALRQRTGARRVHALPNWVDVPEEVTPLPTSPPFTLVFVGGLIVRKGIYDLLDAVRLLNDVDLRVHLVGGAGEDGAGAQAALEAAAADLVAAGRVAFAGELDAREVRVQLRASHLFVLPTRAEGLPLALLEALAEGRPVLTGDAGDIRRTVEKARAGAVLASTAPADIAAEIRQLLDHPDALREAGLNGHVYAQQLRETCIQELRQLIGEG